MSSRAAWRLETLGFQKVYRYEPGKADWSANGLPVEGNVSSIPTAADAVRRGAPTCSFQENVADAAARARAANWDACIVTVGVGIVLGRLRRDVLTSSQVAGAKAEDVMELGPTTIRPDVRLRSILKRMTDRNVDDMLVTTSDGGLVGVLYREDAERKVGSAAEARDEEACECD
jgi:CBS domain-containing protein